MKISPQVRDLLPLRRDSHREIAASNQAVVCEIYSGFIGIDAANELERLIVTAVNAHEALVSALSIMVAANATGREVSIGEFRAATEALALAEKP